jgi:hypothetical protein
MLGEAVVARLAAGTFFLQFWRRTADRLFLIFAVAFWILGVNSFALAFSDRDTVRT